MLSLLEELDELLGARSGSAGACACTMMPSGRKKFSRLKTELNQRLRTGPRAAHSRGAGTIATPAPISTSA